MPSQKRTRQKLTSSQKRTSWKPTSSENLAWSKWTDPSRDRSGGFEASQVGWLSDRSLRDERAAGRRWSSGVERMVHGELRGPVPREAPAWCLQTARPRVEVVEVGPGGVGRLGSTRSFSGPTRFGSLDPVPSSVPASSHEPDWTTTPSARTGLHSYSSPSSELSGWWRGGSRQSVVTSRRLVRQSGSALAEAGL